MFSAASRKGLCMRQRTVLIVDDSPEDNATLSRYLTRSGDRAYRILMAFSGETAIKLLWHETPDCILLDFQLPDMDGLEVLTELSNESGLPRFPVVMLTGIGDTALAVRAIQQGAQDYLTKDTATQETITRAINNAIDKHLLHQQLEAQRETLRRRNVELEAVNAALRESEARFRLLTDSAPVLIWTSGPDMRYDYFNKPWLEFTGRTLAAEVGNGWTEKVESDDLPECLSTYFTAFAARQPFRREFRLRRHDGQARWLLDSGTPRFSPDDDFLGYIGFCIDVTDQRMLQQQLFESQKLESLGQLAGGISHDFNNLLTAILGYTEISLLSLPGQTEVHSFLQEVKAATERAAALIRQLLMYARREMVEFTNVDINRVILNMAPLFRRTIGEQYELVVLMAEDSCYARTNISHMEQVLTNLVINARDAMPQGGHILIKTECVTLDTEFAQQHLGVIPGEYLLYSVSDHGCGMTAEVRSRIFEPFYTTKEVGKGTGLGLATCYGIVKQSQGNILVDSEPGKGATFKVYLPRIRSAAHNEPARHRDALSAGTEIILLVDDEPMVRDVAARILRGHGYQVLVASNGPDALHQEGEWSGEIDMLLTDMVMPLMGGKELADRMQKLRPGIKVMYMSGYAQNIALQQGVLTPDVILLTKPFMVDDLLRKVREAFSTSHIH
jgi:PAS domain S-box-containing protein